MEFRDLQHVNLHVSRLCLGTMTFGKPVEQSEADRMVNTCIDAGINFIDTANAYQLGIAEQMLGNALKGKRDRVVLASKVRMKMGEGPDESGLSRRAIVRAIEDTLRRLQTDYLDIYFLHQPDYDTPIEETLEAMDALVRQGKIRYPGTSNYASWQLAHLLDLSRENSSTPAYISQPMYNLLARGIEQEFLPMAKTFGVSILAYNPLAGGLLTGKHTVSLIPEGGRFDKNRMYQDRYWNAQTFHAVGRLKALAERASRSLIGLSFSWLLHHTACAVVIIGASSMEQLNQNLAACTEGPLSEEIVAECDQVWEEFRGPLPNYNR